jgi:hypothetical protein
MAATIQVYQTSVSSQKCTKTLIGQLSTPQVLYPMLLIAQYQIVYWGTQTYRIDDLITDLVSTFDVCPKILSPHHLVLLPAISPSSVPTRMLSLDSPG